MDPYDEPIEEISREEMEETFEEAIDAADKLHKTYADATQDAAYTHDVLIKAFPRVTVLFDLAGDNPEIYPTVASGIQYAKSLGVELNRLNEIAGGSASHLRAVVHTTGSFGGSTDAASYLADIGGNIDLPDLPLPLPRNTDETYVSKLKKLDPALAASYEQIWETIYGTSSDKFRAALYMMRQVYDHFFATLAPDEEVRESEFWRPKETDKPNQIYRSERVRYAAAKHLKDIHIADTLAAASRHTVELHMAANSAHKRGELDEIKAEKTLRAMDQNLKDWIDAID